MSTIFMIGFLLSPILLIVGLIRPRTFKAVLRSESRKRVVLACILLFIGSFIGFAATVDPSEISPRVSTKNEDQAEPSAPNTDETQNQKNNPDQSVAESDSGEAVATDPVSPASVEESPSNPVVNPVIQSETAQEPKVENTVDSTVQPTQQPPTSTYKVSSVVDGDTIKIQIDGQTKSVRLIGIDTPETVHPSKPVECFGKEASAYTRTALDGKEVVLELDASQGDTDKYGRLLRYVFVGGSNFNEKIIRDGFAYEYTYQSAYKYQSTFKEAQKAAQGAKRGLWADGVCAQQSDSSSPEATSGSSSQTPAPSPAITSSCQCSSNSYNYGDFTRHEEAQSVFDCCMASVGYDVHKLDQDSDGEACETLP